MPNPIYFNMKKNICGAVLILVLFSSCSRSLSGEQLLDKAIAYHDPNGNWATFNGKLSITMETPDQSRRDSEIIINLPDDYFYSKAVKDTLTTEYEVDQGKCTITFNGKTEFTEEMALTYRLNCETAKRYKNYYTYLYGLPMKLKDPGTVINPTVERKTFRGKEYLVLKASYEEEVGSDIWFFYFDPETYTMEVYQFFRSDENGAIKEDTGEYILLSESETISAIKMPKKRAWYYNKDDKYLGTDVLQQ